MKSPGIFVLTKREQRAAIVIAVALVALAMATHHRDNEKQIIPTTSTSAEPSITPPLAEEDSADSGD